MSHRWIALPPGKTAVARLHAPWCWPSFRRAAGSWRSPDCAYLRGTYRCWDGFDSMGILKSHGLARAILGPVATVTGSCSDLIGGEFLCVNPQRPRRSASMTGAFIAAPVGPLIHFTLLAALTQRWFASSPRTSRPGVRRCSPCRPAPSLRSKQAVPCSAPLQCMAFRPGSAAMPPMRSTNAAGPPGAVSEPAAG